MNIEFSVAQDNRLIKLNKQYFKSKMPKSSISIIFSHACGYSLLLNQFLIKEEICKKYQVTLTIYDVTILDNVIPLKKAERWNNYPACAETNILEKNEYKFAKLRPIIFFKNYKGKVTKIMGYKKEQLTTLLETDLKGRLSD